MAGLTPEKLIAKLVAVKLDLQRALGNVEYLRAQCEAVLKEQDEDIRKHAKYYGEDE